MRLYAAVPITLSEVLAFQRFQKSLNSPSPSPSILPKTQNFGLRLQNYSPKSSQIPNLADSGNRSKLSVFRDPLVYFRFELSFTFTIVCRYIFCWNCCDVARYSIFVTLTVFLDFIGISNSPGSEVSVSYVLISHHCFDAVNPFLTGGGCVF